MSDTYKRWKIDWQGEVLTSDTAPAGAVGLFAELGLTDYEAVSPLTSPRSLLMWVAFVECRRSDSAIEDALRFVGEQPLRSVLESLSEWQPTGLTENEPADLEGLVDQVVADEDEAHIL